MAASPNAAIDQILLECPDSTAGRLAPARGYVHVYTGLGKGKTTAAFGLALRAAGHGMRVWIGQFMKTGLCGEVEALRQNPLVHIEQFGRSRSAGFSRLSPDDLAEADRGLQRASAAVTSGDYGLVILDEIDIAVSFGLLNKKQLIDLIDARPESVELVATGRWAPQVLLERADLITEMREVRHYFHDGVPARAGIEF